MSDAQFTRCPHCKATFEVTSAQLSAASGKVRCGACMNVFDAIAYLITSPQEESNTEEPSLENSIDRHDEDELVFEDSEEEKQEANKQLFENDQLSDSFLDLDKEEPKGIFANESNLVHETTTESSNQDENWASELLEQSNESSDASRKAPFIGDELSEQSPPRHKQDSEPSISDPIDFYYEEETHVHGRSTAAKIGISLACFALILTLIAQAAWFHYEKLVRYPALKQGFELVCAQLGCALPELADLNKIRSNNLVVRSHPLLANALIIDVVLTNEADFAQDYPRLALYFSDINGKTIAQKIIAPDEYLSQAFNALEQMPSNKPIHVSLELEDPGKSAVNYKIRFFPNKVNKSNT